MVRSGPRPFVRLVARIAPVLDGGSSVFMGSFPKNLALVVVGPRVGRCYGDVITSHHDGPTPAAVGEEEESAPWPQLPRSSQR